MNVGVSTDGIHYNAIFQTSESGMLVPILMQWNDYLWRVHQVAAPGTCPGAGPEYKIDKIQLPLTPSASFSAVATVPVLMRLWVRPGRVTAGSSETTGSRTFCFQPGRAPAHRRFI